VAARSTSRASFRLELRDRVAAGNQLLLCGIVVVLFTGGLALGSLTRPGLFAIGALVIAIGAIVALSVPWSQVPPGGSLSSLSWTSPPSRCFGWPSRRAGWDFSGRSPRCGSRHWGGGGS
jgi:hypothetical protein